MNIIKNRQLIFFLTLSFFVGFFYSFSDDVVFSGEDQQASVVGSIDLVKKENSNNELVTENENKNQEVSFIAVGDIMLSRNVAKEIKEKENTNYPFLKTKELFKNADIVFGNLESPITEGRDIETGEMIFRTDPSMTEAIKDAGFSILSLANNHTPNFGGEGLIDTFNYLNRYDIKYVGAGKNTEETNKPVYINSKGFKFAFLAYTEPSIVSVSYEVSENYPGTVFMNLDNLVKNIEEAKNNADFVIVSMHSGDEYVDYPNKYQKKFAHTAIDSGADLVIGHHPHVVQPMEKYNGKYIFYSLGNFIFDQTFSEETQRGLVIKFIFNKDGIDKLLFLPTLIDGFSQPEFLGWNESEDVLNRLKYHFVPTILE